MSNNYQFDEVSRFTAGTEGEPGRRIFYLQVLGDAELVSFRLEKQQVEAVAEYLAGVLTDLPQAPLSEVPSDVSFTSPAIEVWIVGSIGVAFDEDASKFVLLLEELTADPEEDHPTDGGVAQISLTIGQATAFVPHAVALINSGRPPCPLCDRPLNPDGHRCARLNGHGVH